MSPETPSDVAHTRAVWEYDCRSASMLWSPEFGRLFGLADAVPPNAYTWLQTIAPEDRALVEAQLFQPGPGTATVAIECRHLRGAEVLRMRVSGRVFRDAAGTPQRVVGFGANVTTAAATADASGALAGTVELLANRVAEFDALMNLLPTPVVVAEDPECRFIRGNAAFVEMFRVEPGANVSVTAPEDQRPPWRAFRDGRVLGGMELPVQRSAALGVRVFDEPVTIVFDSGRELDLITSVTPLFDSAGQPRGAVGVFTDITGRRERDAFVSMVAHELRQPLGALITAHELLAMNPSSTPALDVARRQTLHMSRMVDDLMDAARLSRGTLTLVREEIDLVPLLRQTIDAVGPVLERRGQRVALAGAARAIVNGDPARLRQVFTNLVHNAAKFGTDGDEILVSVSVADAGVSVEVTDHGRGIAPDQLPRIFDLFTSASDARLGGLGIGLHIVRSIAVLHGGDITARSAGRGAGTTFTVTLPAVA